MARVARASQRLEWAVRAVPSEGREGSWLWLLREAILVLESA
jgi:hypothetical protein